MTNTANLLEIRPLNGSQQFAFEELCCQLASLEPRKDSASFQRKGSGADAGIECLIQHDNGSETGWQAKFLSDFDSNKTGQITKSFKQAVEKHPKLSCFIVCLPIDLKDGRTGKRKTEGQRWLDWKTARIQDAKNAGRNITIQLWQATDIRERLYRNDPYYAGRLHFFFNELHFSTQWFKKHFDSARGSLGQRYTPQFHVSLPVRQSLLGLARDEKLHEQLADWSRNLSRHINKLSRFPDTVDDAGVQYDTLIKTGQVLIDSMSTPVLVAMPFPLTRWLALIKELQTIIHTNLEYCWALIDGEEDKQKYDRIRDVLHKFSEFDHYLDETSTELSADIWKLANQQAVVVYGEAGVGKSHLLADITADSIKKGLPAILLINSQFFLQNPRTQILELLDLRNISFSTLLGVLDSLGQSAGCRALLMIDAINERHGIELWCEHMAPLISEINKFPHLALIVSCRTTYLNYLKLPESLQRLEHHGFAHSGGKAAKAYLTQRKIMRPSSPNLLPEFNNPLFLKTCCDSLERKGLNVFPKDLQGLSSLFDFFMAALATEITGRMALTKRRKIVERALNEFTKRLFIDCSAYLPIDETDTCFEQILPSAGMREKSLLDEFEHEGVLTVEQLSVSADECDEQVRFTYERFSDFQIARYLLNQQAHCKADIFPLLPSTPLYDFLHRENLHRFAGIVEALAVLIPEQSDYELPELVDCQNLPSMKWIVEKGFFNSLLTRQQNKFTAKTRQWVIKLSRGHDRRWLSTLISVSTEPDNQYNAYFLHDELALLAMAQRDAKWSIAIVELYEEGSPINELISWALDFGFDEIDKKRAELAAIMLTWLFSTSHRTIRDRATKALVALLAPRLRLANALIKRFRQVDDLYILERLLAACYGAVLQAKSRNGLEDLSKTVYNWQFANNTPSVNILLRDYARGILEYACHLNRLPANYDMGLVRPPYKSEWPLKYVSEETVEAFKNKGGRDHIVSSAGSEWTGDFAKYIIKPAVSKWSTTTLDCEEIKGPSDCLELFLTLIGDQDNQTQEAYYRLFGFCVKCVNELKKDVDKEEFKEKEKVLLSCLNDELKFIYEMDVRSALLYWGQDWFYKRSQSFNVNLSQRWVVKRAHDMGWTAALFGEYDSHIGTGRSRHNKHIERIGKKYQWLAFYELLAYMADNLIYIYRYSDEIEQYEGPWQIWGRNIDPSLLIDETKDDGWKAHSCVWWSPETVKLQPLNNQQQKLWLENERDQLNSTSLIDVFEVDNNQRWLVLKGFKNYNTDSDSGINIDSWCRIWCVIVRAQEQTKFIEAIGNQALIDPHVLPDPVDFNNAFIGEYPWHPACYAEDDWMNIDADYGFDGEIIPTVAQFEIESGNNDRSLKDTVRIHLPAPWLIEKLGLRLNDGQKLLYTNDDGKTLFKDPSISEAGPSAALVDKTAFIDLLKKEGLSPVWIIAGEKGAYGETEHGYIGRRVHSFVYVLNEHDDIVRVSSHIENERAGEFE